MSNSLYPTVPGLTYPIKRTEEWPGNVRQTAPTGKEVTLRISQNPVRHWELLYDYLKNLGSPPTAFLTLVDFFNQMGGDFDTFLYTDPDDNSVTDQNFGTGNGSQTTFQLVRQLVSGGFSEWIQNTNVVTNVKINGVVQGGGTYTVTSVGTVIFNTPPGNGLAITWTGTYFWRCRFEMSTQEFQKDMAQLWSVKSVKFKSVKS